MDGDLNEKVPIKSLDNDSSKRVLSTKKHYIYCNADSNKVLKVLKSTNPSEKDIESLNNELKISNDISHPGFRRALHRTTFKGREAIMLEWAGGYNISEIYTVLNQNLRHFLEISHEITSILLFMHRKQIMHLNLSCEHIIIDEKSNSVKVIGCGSSSSFSGKMDYISNQELRERDLRCVSPELMGRFNREVDFRSDFYSLGVIFYRLLCGRYPFSHENPLAIIKMHMGQEPLNIRCYNPSIPIPLSQMIMKLLNKKAEDRYQCASGIIHDLDLMLSEYDTDKTLASVEIAQHDKHEVFLVPQKLYSRKDEYARLNAVYRRLNPNRFELAFVSGCSGLGKSSLILEMYKSVIQRGGIFLRGKFDICRGEPFSALIEAIDNFCDNLLMEDKATIANYKSKILDAVGDESKLMTDLVPHFHLVTGYQPQMSEAIGKEAKRRINYVLLKFFKAICSVGAPVILVLEDLQWSDFEVMNFLSILVSEKCIKNMLIIGTYRDNEVNSDHHVSQLIESAVRNDVNLTQIRLQNLSQETVNNMISEALLVSPLDCYLLTSTVYQKTKGNPFFTRHILKSLFEDGIIFFCRESRKWKWDLSNQNEKIIAEDVLGLLRKKILSFEIDIVQTLKVASCIGSPFSRVVLKYIIDKPDGLDRALKTGMIVPYKGEKTSYRFTHDYVQQAAYSLLPHNRSEFFLSLGNKLWKMLSSSELDENIFVIADLFMKVDEIVVEFDQHLEMAQLFMTAGRRALSSTAFAQASNYLTYGKRFLHQDCWKTNYALTLEFYNMASKAEYCSANESKMNCLIDNISRNVTSPFDLVHSFHLRIRLFNDKNMNEEAIATGLKILKELGLYINVDNAAFDSVSEVEDVKKTMERITEKDILKLKQMDEITIPIMMILSDILLSCLRVNAQLHALITAKMVQLTFKRGLSKYASTGFGALGASLSTQGDKLGYKCGQLSLLCLKKAPAKELIPIVYTSFYAMISPFNSSVHQSVYPFLKAHRVSLETGILESARVSACIFCHYGFLSGVPLLTLQDKIDELKTTLGVTTICFTSVQQAVINLSDINYDHSTVLHGDVFHYESCYDNHEIGFFVSKALLMCIIYSYLFHDFTSALTFLNRYKTLQHYDINVYHRPLSFFYDGLVSLALARQGFKKIEMMKRARECLSILSRFSKKSEVNFLNKTYLLEAGLASLDQNKDDALAKFNDAILLSRKNGFLNEEAISCENAAIYLLSLKSEEAVQLFYRSFDCYSEWGAYAKTSQIRRKYSYLFYGKNMHMSTSSIFFPDITKSSSSVSSELSIPSMEMTQGRYKRVRFS